MIDWLFAVIAPFTLCCVVLLFIRKVVIQNWGAKVSYLSWMILPASLIVPVVELPNWYALINNGQSIQRYLTISSTPTISEWLTPIILYAWLTGFTVLLIYWLFKHLTTVYKKCDWQKINKSSIKVLSNSKLEVWQTEQIFSPMLVGVIRPKLLLPYDFEELFSREQQKLILEHELCHYRRGDLVWNCLALFILALMWFHPLAWLAFSRFRRDQELSCDQVVLAHKHTRSRINYSKALLIAAETPPPLGVAQLSFKEYGDKHVMFERINLIQKMPSSSKLVSTIALTCAVSLLSAMSYAGNDQESNKYTKNEISPIKRIEPNYPVEAANNKIEGSVVLKFDINATGDVTNVSVVKAIPEKVFDKVAKTALRQWKYESSSTGVKNNLVQLDFAMDKHSNFKFKKLTEQIQVNKS